MSHSINVASSASVPLGKTKHEAKAGHDLNPAQQARSADPTAKGAVFGALVSSIARAKHAPPPAPPVTEPPVETSATTAPAPPVDIVV